MYFLVLQCVLAEGGKPVAPSMLLLNRAWRTSREGQLHHGNLGGSPGETRPYPLVSKCFAFPRCAYEFGRLGTSISEESKSSPLEDDSLEDAMTVGRND